MAFDTALAGRIRQQLGRRAGLAEKTMFGGLAFLRSGNMCVGVHGKEMIVRLDPADTDAALKRPHVRVFDLSGRPMKGWILVGPKGLARADALARWVKTGLTYAASLPAK